MADNLNYTNPGTGKAVAFRDQAGDGSGPYWQRIDTNLIGSDGFIPGNVANGLDVDVTRVPANPFGLDADAASATGSISAKLRQLAAVGINVLTIASGDNNIGNVDIVTLPNLPGSAVAHDAVDSGGPVKIGMRAVSYGSNPTAVAAADRTDWLASRAGIPWVIGGHPNVQTVKHANITTAVTDAAIISASAGTRIVVTRITVTLDNASTVFPSVLIGFGATNTPTTTGVLAAHGGVPAGGGFTIGSGSGILGVGGDGDDLRITTVGAATGNGLQVTVSYYTIETG